MSLSDSLMPDRLPERQQDASGPRHAAAPSPIEALYARTDANVDGEFRGIFGAGGPEARTALESAAATEGRSAYARFRVDPDAFGTAVGNRERADIVGGALDALNYSKAYHGAQQEGRTPSVPGDGAPRRESSPDQELSLSIGPYDGIYLDSRGNQIGRFGNPNDRLFVVTDASQAQQMQREWSAHTNSIATLQTPIRGALEIPSLDALRAMRADITSHSWSETEISGLWGVDAAGKSHVGLGGIGDQHGRSAVPTAKREGMTDSPGRQLGLVGASQRGTYHSHPLYVNGDFSDPNNVSTGPPPSDRANADYMNRYVDSDQSANVLMNPTGSGMTIIYTSQEDVMRVRTIDLIKWQNVNGILVK